MDDNNEKILVDAGEYKMLIAEQARLNAVVDYIMFNADGYVDANTILVIAGNFDEALTIKRGRNEKLSITENNN